VEYSTSKGAVQSTASLGVALGNSQIPHAHSRKIREGHEGKATLQTLRMSHM